MSYLPCKNPNCHSYGKPHPNCRCYGEMAEGGEAFFCSKARAHNPGCEYFAEGGESGDWEPETHDAPTPASDSSEWEPEGETPSPDWESSEEHYSTPGQQAATTLEGAAQGFLGPGATAAEIGYSKLNPNEQSAAGAAIQHALPRGPGSLVGLAARSALDFMAGQGMAPEDIAARQTTNPIEHGASEFGGLAASFMSGAGEAGLIGQAAERAAQLANMGKTGANILKGAIANGLVQGGDEVSKWMLGQGNPEDGVGSALAHMGGAALFGLLPGTVGRMAGKPVSGGLEKLAETKAGTKIAGWLAGFGAAAGKGPESATAAKVAYLVPHGMSAAYKSGQKAFGDLLDKGISNAAKEVGSNVGTWAGSAIGGPAGSIIGSNIGRAIAIPVGSLLERLAGPAAKKYVAPVTLKILSSGNTSGILDALNHAESMAAGYDTMTKSVNGLFGAGVKTSEASPKAIDALHDYISNGGFNQDVQEELYDQNAKTVPAPGFAEGGEVKASKEPHKNGKLLKDHDGVAMHYPEHNIILNAARGRVSNYLNGLRPSPHSSRLAFDDEPDTREQESGYRRALSIAVAPMSVLNEVHKGTIEAEHVKHLTSMYPEVHGLMQKRITERIVQAQLDGEKPSYQTRQGLSLLMGTALSSELTPQSIQAAQAVFAQQNAANQQGQAGTQKPKKDSASLTKSDQSYLTGPQALTKRSQKA